MTAKAIVGIVAFCAISSACQAQRQAGSDRFSNPVIVSSRSEPQATGVQDDFKISLQIVLDRMVTKKKKGEKNPLRIAVLDKSLEPVKQFLNASSPIASIGPDQHNVISVAYHSEARFDGKPTAACMVEYDSSRRADLLSGYERFFLNKDDVLYYIAAHEFGHCMSDHQAMLGKGKNLDAKNHELIADRVAVAFFMVNGKEQSAAKIVEFNNLMQKDSIHYHKDEIKAFYDVLKERSGEFSAKKNINSMLDVYKLATD